MRWKRLLLVVVIDLDLGFSLLWRPKCVSDLLLLYVLVFTSAMIANYLVIITLSVKKELAFTSLHSHQAFNALRAEITTGGHATTRCEISVWHGVHVVLHWILVGRVILESSHVNMGSCWLTDLLDQWVEVLLIECSVVVWYNFVDGATSCVVG